MPQIQRHEEIGNGKELKMEIKGMEIKCKNGQSQLSIL